MHLVAFNEGVRGDKFKEVMKILPWLVGALTLSICLFLVVRYGLNPKPIAKMNPTVFENLEQVGAVVYRRLHVDIRKHKVIVVGSSPFIKGYEKVWDGFLRTALEQNDSFETILVQPELNFSHRWPTKSIYFGGPVNDLARQIESGLKKGNVFIHTANVLTPHSAEVEILKSLELQLGQPILVFSQQKFVVSRDQLNSILPACDEESLKFQLSCLAEHFSKRFFRKKLSQDKLYAGLEQIGRSDYIVYITQP